MNMRLCRSPFAKTMPGTFQIPAAQANGASRYCRRGRSADFPTRSNARHRSRLPSVSGRYAVPRCCGLESPRSGGGVHLRPPANRGRIRSFLCSAILAVSFLRAANPASGQVLWSDDFDGLACPLTVTNSGTTNGYNIRFSAPNGIENFTAIFGFDYSSVTYPTTIPAAPHSSAGTTKGLYLTVNKDPVGHPFGAASGVAPGTNSAVNLYPVGQSFSGSFSLRADVWINWTNLAFSTEHALFGINHSGALTNRITAAGSDGLFLAMDGDGGVLATSTTLRDFALFQGRPGLSPLLLRTNTFTFGPAPLLGPQFDNSDPGLASLFPSKAIYGGTPAGSPGLGWVTVQIDYLRSNNVDRVTWRLNNGLTNPILAQYTNTTPFTSGDILLGYDDVFNSLGDTNDFAVMDNVVVSQIPCISLNCPTNKIVDCGSAWDFDPPTVVSACCSNVTITVLSTITNAGPCPALVTRTWLATDSCGNTATCSQSVSIRAPLEPGVTTLVSTGACWRYYDRGPGLGPEWNDPNYDDSTWLLGSAKLGYGDGDEATQVRFGGDPSNKFITTYFRRAFFMPAPCAFTNVLLRLKRDDGAAVYVNGAEVFRSNLPPGPLNDQTLAPVALDHVTNFLTANLNPSLFNEGENTVAVEIHQSATNGLDIGFDLGLTGQSSLGDATLITAVSGNNVVLSWPLSASSSFGLQRSADFINWFTVPNALVQAGCARSVSVPITSSKQFYRLCAQLPLLPASAPPLLLWQPLRLQVAAGANTNLAVVVDGVSPFTYAWRRNQRSAGGTNTILTLSNVQRESGGAYDVLICNADGCIQSCPILFLVGGSDVALADNFADRANFTDVSASLNTSNAVATTEPGEPVNPAGSYGRTLWLQWTAPASGVAVFDTKGSAVATAIAVYTGTSLTNLHREAYGGLNDRAFTSTVVFNAVGGMAYQVQLDGAGLTSGLCLNWRLTPTTDAAPQIVQQPQSAYVKFGSNATFTVGATLPAPLTNSLLSYQWFSEGVCIAGATNSTFSVASFDTNHIAQYFVVVSFTNGLSATSDVVNVVGVVDPVGTGSISPPTSSSFGSSTRCPGTWDHYFLYYFRVPKSAQQCTTLACSCSSSGVTDPPLFQPATGTATTNCVAVTNVANPNSPTATCVTFDTVTGNSTNLDTALYVTWLSACSTTAGYACNDDAGSGKKTSSYTITNLGTANNSCGLIKVYLLYKSATLPAGVTNITLNYNYCQ